MVSRTERVDSLPPQGTRIFATISQELTLWYQYEIRLLTILPGRRDDALLCSLKKYDLDVPLRSYVAISYPWGPPEDPEHHCIVDGIDFVIRDNAYNILSRLRQPNLPIDVWIDVLCIDQANKPEKGHQISLMYRIYAESKQVCIWLGKTLEPNDEIVEYIRSLDVVAIRKEFLGRVFQSAELLQHKSFLLDMVRTDARREQIVNGAAQIFYAVWFSRVWIRQEAAVGANPVLLWGDHQLPWSNIAVLAWIFLPRYTISFPEWTTFRYNEVEKSINTILAIENYRMRIAQETTSSPATPLFSMMLHARSGLTTKPHDKVYALSSMASDTSRTVGLEQFLKPNYNLSWQEVYVNAARMFFSYDNNPHQVLEHAGLVYQGVNSDLPSWVPDWRYSTFPWMLSSAEWWAGGNIDYVRTKIQPMSKKQRSQMCSYQGHASITPLCATLPRDRCGNTSTVQYQLLGPKDRLSVDSICSDSMCVDKISKAEANYLQSASRAAQILEIKILMRDEITHLGGKSTWIYDNDFDQAHRQSVFALDVQNLNFLEKRATMVGHELYITDETLRQAYNATLIMSQNHEDQFATLQFTSTAENWRQWLQHDIQNTLATDDASLKYHLAIENRGTFRDGIFAFTDNGYMALVPNFTQRGDSIVIISGYRTPFVIRPTVQDWFILVGPCYVHGMMTDKATELMDEFDIRVDEKTGETCIKRPQGDVRANGLKMEAGRYVDILHTLGRRWIKLI